MFSPPHPGWKLCCNSLNSPPNMAQSKSTKAKAPTPTEISDLTQDFIDLCLPSPKGNPMNKLTNLPGLHKQLEVLVLPDKPSTGYNFYIQVIFSIRCRFKVESPDGSQSVINLHMLNQVSVTPIKQKIKAEEPDPLTSAHMNTSLCLGQ
jgi:hypothetical protein